MPDQENYKGKITVTNWNYNYFSIICRSITRVQDNDVICVMWRCQCPED